MLYKILVFGPLLGAVIAGFGGRRMNDKVAMGVTTALLILSMILSWSALFQTGFGQQTIHIRLWRFLDIGLLQADWALNIDTLTAVMMVVITTVSALVHLYSWGYMRDDDSRPRFFAFLSLFTFAMLILVSADNFLQLFFGWEGVGLASYLLIGYYFKKPSANAAAIKAFVTNRVGDIGLAMGIMSVFFIYGSVQFETVFAAVQADPDRLVSFLGWQGRAVELVGFLLFFGAMGKSAQFVLHVWLPDAMEGPTPVSALIHAATMVTAGVFLVCRAYPIYELAPYATSFMTIVGAFTAFFAATVALVQNDIKRVIAYSTCSQLGYMFFAAGVGAYNVAIFHLFTHAFFKALLFLGAGSVIHALHHQQDMRLMGGLRHKIKITYGMMVIGTLALTGIGVPGTVFGFAGFFSKDAIIEAAYATAVAGGNSAAIFAFWMGIIVAFMTSFYAWRLIFMTFHGAHRCSYEHYEEAHESPSVMLVSLYILAAGAVLAGVLFYGKFVAADAAYFWRGALPAGDHARLAPEYLHAAAQPDHMSDVGSSGHHNFPAWVLWSPFLVSIAGFIVAWLMYIRKQGTERQLAKKRDGLYTFLLNKWYVDELYELTLVRGARGLGDLFWKTGDRKLIDGLGPNGISALSLMAGRGISRLQSGKLFHYAFIMLIGLVMILTIIFVRGQ